jgi:hypothetical protein
MTNAAILDMFQAHIFYLSKIPGVFWQNEIYLWVKNLATQNEIL